MNKGSRRLHGGNPGAWTQCRRLEGDDPGAWIELLMHNLISFSGDFETSLKLSTGIDDQKELD